MSKLNKKSGKPNPGQAASADKITDIALISKISTAVAGQKDLISSALRNWISGLRLKTGLNAKADRALIIKFIIEIAKDNQRMIADVLGPDLTVKIQRYEF